MRHSINAIKEISNHRLMSPEEIQTRVRDIKEGTGDFGEFASYLMRFVISVVSHHYTHARKKNIDYRELWTNAIIVLYDTVRTYEPERGTFFLSLFKSNLTWRTMLFIRHQGVVHIPANISSAVEYLPLYVLKDQGELWKQRITAIETEIEVEHCLTKLNTRELSVVRYSMHNYKDIEIAKELGITREYVRQIKEKAFRKLASGKTGEKLYSLMKE